MESRYFVAGREMTVEELEVLVQQMQAFNDLDGEPWLAGYELRKWLSEDRERASEKTREGCGALDCMETCRGSQK